MSDQDVTLGPFRHDHVFLGEGHDRNARKTWAVIWLCGIMMVAEIVGGSLFGSLALVADGLHMSTHASALLLAAVAYSCAKRYAADTRFAFGTGKLGDLAGFSSAIILALIALFIGYEAVSRLLHPVAISFDEAIPIAVAGLGVNIASAWMLSGGEHHHRDHRYDDVQGHGHARHEEVRRIDTGDGVVLLEIYEDGVPPRFRIRFEDPQTESADDRSVALTTARPDGTVQTFTFADRADCLESVEEITEPHEFIAHLGLVYGGRDHNYTVVFTEHDDAADMGGSVTAAHRDNNMRAAFVHVMADAAVSVLAIFGLSAGKFLGWVFMDPAMGIVGALVIANWSYGLIRDTGAILLDMNPDRRLAEELRRIIESEGDRLADLHLWRLGPGHLGAIVSVVTREDRGEDFYRARLGHFRTLSHLTIEVQSRYSRVSRS
jgi:cation diffusion facilitator family transporter